RGALRPAVRDDAMRLDPLGDDPQHRPRDDELRLARHRNAPPSTGHAPNPRGVPPSAADAHPPARPSRRYGSAPNASPGSSTAANPSSAAPARSEERRVGIVGGWMVL